MRFLFIQTHNFIRITIGKYIFFLVEFNSIILSAEIKNIPIDMDIKMAITLINKVGFFKNLTKHFYYENWNKWTERTHTFHNNPTHSFSEWTNWKYSPKYFIRSKWFTENVERARSGSRLTVYLTINYVVFIFTSITAFYSL